MKLINIIPIHLFLYCTHGTVLPKDDNSCCPDKSCCPRGVDSNPPKDGPDGGIKWTQCNLDIPDYKDLEKNKAYECGNLTVPLDYTDKGNKNHTILNLIKLKADKESTNKAPKGSIIMNPGGPGASGVEFLLQLDPNITNSLFDGQYDIISFDPRGTGKTLVPPESNGFPKQMTDELFYAVQNSSYSLIEQVELLFSDFFDYVSTFTELFVTRDEEFRKFRGTAFVARDIAEIATALDEGNQINYWGSSYGTVLGQVLAGMFPGRIERMLLDGNLLVDDYVENLGLDSIRDAEEALYHFYDECMAASNNTCHSANKLPKQRDGFLKALNRVFMVCTGVGGALDRPKSLSLTGRVLGALYRGIDGYLELDDLIDTALEGNRSMCLQERSNATLSTLWSPQSELAHLAILCTDATFRAETIEEFISYFSLYEGKQALHNPFFLWGLLSTSPCSRWNVHAAQPINLTSLSRIKTKNPVLLFNGRYDPVTPLGNARKISARFPGSQVVVYEGVGHGALLNAHSSSCISDIVTRYFIDGEVPRKETTCKPDQTAFELVEERRKKRAELGENRKIPVFL
ncbi:tripeptidyl aminopeptidase [Fusarium sp. NRRL 52700]|nr:tripeptidyl aminopeptidase [Fusarium sp. NRRL 52700]